MNSLEQQREDQALGAAWRRCVAALPNVDRTHPLYIRGPWRLRISGPWNITYNGRTLNYSVVAEPYNATGVGNDRDIERISPDLAEALDSLAEELSAEPNESADA